MSDWLAFVPFGGTLIKTHSFNHQVVKLHSIFPILPKTIQIPAESDFFRGF